jgi:hypothetical protein
MYGPDNRLNGRRLILVEFCVPNNCDLMGLAISVHAQPPRARTWRGDVPGAVRKALAAPFAEERDFWFRE